MTKHGYSALAAVTIAWTGPAVAQSLEPRPFPQVNVESYQLRSRTMQRTYDISVGLPADYATNPSKRYPAILATDGNRVFPMAHNVASGLAGFEPAIEQLFIISVDAPFELGDTTYTRRRVHEFSPPGWNMEDPFGRAVREMCAGYKPREPMMECTGGAPRFFEFLRDELLPLLMAKYRIDPAQLGLFGVSAGGFFASYVIFQPDSPFTTYIISSPAMAYGDGEIFRLEARYAADHKNLPVRIYLSSGSREIDDPRLEGVGQIVSGQARLGGLLQSRQYPGLRLYSEIHHGLGHTDVAPVTLARGIRLFYSR